ncbi:MAG: helix-turn-helix domain-containing protein [Planctomycetes bacterium]|nr:helix-turn-helix domain-containing protein [Planctomycetota bacterium]
MATRTDRYAELVEAFPLRPIRSERQLDRATEIANRLAVRARLTRDEQDYLDVLSVLIERYEDERHAIADVSDVEALQFLIYENGLTLAKLGRAVGIGSATLSAVLSGERELTRRHVERLCAYFQVDGGLFIRPTKLLS